MSEPEDSKPVTEMKYGEKDSRGKWLNVSEDKRAQYEAIEKRVREKMERGEL